MVNNKSLEEILRKPFNLEEASKRVKEYNDKIEACEKNGHPKATGHCDPGRGLKYFSCPTCRSFYSERMTTRDYERVDKLFRRPLI